MPGDPVHRRVRSDGNISHNGFSRGRNIHRCWRGGYTQPPYPNGARTYHRRQSGSPAYFTLDSVAGTATTIIVAFGDGTSVALMNSDSTKVAHIYKLPGTYTVTVSVTDASGQTQSASFPVVVN